MKLRKVTFQHLNSLQKEIYNFQQVAGLLAEYGFNCIKLADDWQSADFLAYHKDGKNTLKVQLKSRISISEKYKRKSLYVTFPVRRDSRHRDWYLIEHAALVALVRKHVKEWLESNSWTKRGGYSSGKPNKELLNALDKYKL